MKDFEERVFQSFESEMNIELKCFDKGSFMLLRMEYAYGYDTMLFFNFRYNDGFFWMYG